MAPAYRGHFSCRVCERGVLVSKKIFRMSGPAVVIGYILLIPSILGMILSLLMFFGVIAFHGDESADAANESPLPIQPSFEASFRRNCINSARRSFQQVAGQPAPLGILEQYCECSLSVVKETRSSATAYQVCMQQLQDGSFSQPNRAVQSWYADALGYSHRRVSQREKTRRNEAATRLFHVIGGGFALFWLVAFFVGGLLGWLLIMKKRVLQCSVCGAVINAS